MTAECCHTNILASTTSLGRPLDWGQRVLTLPMFWSLVHLLFTFCAHALAWQGRQNSTAKKWHALNLAGQSWALTKQPLNAYASFIHEIGQASAGILVRDTRGMLHCQSANACRGTKLLRRFMLFRRRLDFRN